MVVSGWQRVVLGAKSHLSPVPTRTSRAPSSNPLPSGACAPLSGMSMDCTNRPSELRARQLGRLAQHAHFLLHRPALRSRPLHRHLGQVTCLAEPPGERLLRDARLSRHSPGALGTAPREALDHFLRVRKGEWFGHVAIAVLPRSGSSREAIATLALGVGSICHPCLQLGPQVGGRGRLYLRLSIWHPKPGNLISARAFPLASALAGRLEAPCEARAGGK